MHPNRRFRETTDVQNIAFARARGFGVLTLAGPDGVLAAHAPFLLSEDGETVDLHLSNANPVLKALSEPAPCLLIVSGPDGYVSPDWYELDHNQVPTWNYVAIHIRGMLQANTGTGIADLLERESARFEQELAPKTPWTPGKMDAAAFERMQQAITALSISVESIEGTWKLSQNKREEARLRAADAMRANPAGAETAKLSRIMAEPPEPAPGKIAVEQKATA